MSKTNKPATKARRIRNQSAAKAQPIRYAFVPLLQRFRSEHTNKNKESQARTWIPVECSMLIRYEFAALSPQTRYAFVAILLYCGMRGIDVIPLDSKFLSSALIIDERTLRKSLVELENANLLLDREKDLKEEIEKTHRQTDENDVSVNNENLSKTKDENQSENEEVVKKKIASANSHRSQFSLDECLRYVEKCKANGDQIQNARALATNLYRSGESDAFIMATLYPQKQEELDREQFGEPIQFTDEPCRVCFGAKMADADGKGFRACEHCKNERGKSTGFEPKGESESENED